MKWFDFSNIPFIIFSIIAVLLGGFLTFMIVSFATSSAKDHKYIERIQAESTTVRIYVIDAKKNQVIYFNRSDLKNKKNIDMNTFYSHFHLNDIDKIKAWIISICSK